MEDNSGRLSNDMFVQNEEDGDNQITAETKQSKISLKMIIIIVVICAVVLISLGLILYFILREDDEEEKTSYNPIPSNEDLNFTEEAHRLFSREVATQTMVLATNNDVLPLRQTDQVVLFGDGSNNTIMAVGALAKYIIKAPQII